MGLTRLALLLLPHLVAAAPAAAQCDITATDFDGFALGTPLDNVPGWTDIITGTDTRVARPPGGTSPEIWLRSSLARRNLGAFNMPDEYQVRFQATTYGSGRFRMVCPTIIVGMQLILDVRLGLTFDVRGPAPSVFCPASGDRRPIQAGVPVDVIIDVDRARGVVITVDDSLFAVLPWDLTPGPCSSPDSLFWENTSPLSAGDFGMYIDNVCVGTRGAVAGCDPTPNSTGVGASLSGPAEAPLSRDRVALVVRDLPPRAPALWLCADSTAAPTPLSGGELCLGTPTARLLDSLRVADDGGRAVHVLGTRDPLPSPYSSSSSPAFVMAGETWFFQVIYRDLAAAAGANLSSATAVTFVP